LKIQKPFLYALESYLWYLVDIIFPPVCPGCETLGARFCENCQQEVIHLPEKICQICGSPSASSICRQCTISRPPYLQMRSWAVFKHPIRNILHTIKYRRNVGLGQTIAEIMLPDLTALNWPIESIIPIPLSEQRLRERGYNQVALIARPLAQLQSIQYLPNGLRRARHTRSQVGLNLAERKNNIKDAFFADPKRVAGKNILVIDDVTTTGATLVEAASALKRAGAKTVYAYTIAKAPSPNDA